LVLTILSSFWQLLGMAWETWLLWSHSGWCKCWALPAKFCWWWI